MPTMVLVAGPNGSGKTTLVRSGELALVLPVPTVSINADDIARALAGDRAPTDEQSLQAAQIADALVDDLIDAGQSFIVETVLSSAKYRSRVTAAKRAGFQVVLVYVTLRLPTLNVARVETRVRLGGHHVPQDRVRARRERSHAMFAWFAQQADLVTIFDNSAAAPTLAAVKGPSGWLARRFIGAAAEHPDRAEWILLRIDLLPPGLAVIVRTLAADGIRPVD